MGFLLGCNANPLVPGFCNSVVLHIEHHSHGLQHCKEFDCARKVIEEKETWIDAPEKPGQKGETTGLVPAIWLHYWKEDTSNGSGTGKILSFRYSQMDPPLIDSGRFSMTGNGK